MADARGTRRDGLRARFSARKRALPWVAGALLLTTSAARAEDSGARVQAVRVELEAPTGCPDRHDFLQQLLGRSRFRLADSMEAAIELSVVVRGRGHAFDGRLRLREPDATTSERSVRGRDCREVISALALVGALLLEPQVAPDREPELDENGPFGTPPQDPIAERKRKAPSAARPKSKDWQPVFGAGVGFSRRSEVAPEPVSVMAVEASFTAERKSAFSPSVLLAGEYGERVSVRSEMGDAQFQFATPRLAACPLRWPAQGQLGARPCAFGEFGQLSAEGVRIANPDSVSLTWWAVGSFLRLEALLLDALSLNVDAGVVAPLTRDSFVFDNPDLVIHDVPDTATLTRISLTARIR